MKNEIINAAVCDARNVTEERLKSYEHITINAATVITGARAQALLDRYGVSINAAAVISIPEEREIRIKTVSGKSELGPDADGKDVFLLVNGMLTLENDSLKAAAGFYQIYVNGKILMPRSFRGCLPNLSVNGKTAYYPDGAALLKDGAEIDDLFVLRASKTLYHTPGSLFFLDAALDAARLKEKDLRFSADRIFVVRSLLPALIDRFDEKAEIVPLPDGTRRVAGDLSLDARAVRRLGASLCVCGDAQIRDAETLDALAYLYCTGTVTIDRQLEDAFLEKDFVYGELKITEPGVCYVSDQAKVTVDAALLRAYAGGVHVEDCAKVALAADVKPDEILEKLRISDCAFISCTKAQKPAVSAVAKDVALIRTVESQEAGAGEGILGRLINSVSDTREVNAAEYKL